MFFSGLLLSGLAALSGAHALSIGNSTLGRACGTTPSAAQVAAFEAHFAAHKVVPSATKAAATATINIYYHVIQSSTALAGGNVPYVFFQSAAPELPLTIRPVTRSCRRRRT